MQGGRILAPESAVDSIGEDIRRAQQRQRRPGSALPCPPVGLLLHGSAGTGVYLLARRTRSRLAGIGLDLVRVILADLARRRGPRTVVIRPVRDALEYDRKEFDVVAGSRVELLFDNTDIMPHNLVIAAIGALARVGRAGEAMAIVSGGRDVYYAFKSGGSNENSREMIRQRFDSTTGKWTKKTTAGTTCTGRINVLWAGR